MQYYEAPGPIDTKLPSVFLAGGITGCPDWQGDAAAALADHEVAVFNPRRENFPIHGPSAADGQVRWEFAAMKAADVILFWFPAGDSVQPIALYELGRHAALDKKIVVGRDSGYPRWQDIDIQMDLARPGLRVRHHLSDALDEVALELDRLR